MIRHLRFFSIMLTGIFMQNFVHAQAEDSVKMVINGLFSSMKSGNGNELKTWFADSAILQTIVPDKQNGIKVKTEEIAGFADFISKTKAGDADERITYDMIKIDGPLAVAWTPYKFYYKGNFSHCGVNSFHLVRTNAGWKIQYLIDTRRKSNCE